MSSDSKQVGLDRRTFLQLATAAAVGAVAGRADAAEKTMPPLPMSQTARVFAYGYDREPYPLPIDDSDGGCDCQPPCKHDSQRRRQIDTIKIGESEAVTDSLEAFYLLEQRGIKNVILMGVHANMCVLGRPFGIRQMVYQGKNVVLMRDLTDTMYNSRQRPFVSHFAGTDLVIEHIEKYWCPTITSDDVLGGMSFRFINDERPRTRPARDSQTSVW